MMSVKNVKKLLLCGVMPVLSAAVIFILLMPLPHGGIKVSAASVKLSNTEITLITGNSYTLTVSGNSSAVKWSVSDKKVCTVSGGRVTAVSPGEAVVRAKTDGASLECRVKVYDSYISKPASSYTVAVGETAEITVTYKNVKKFGITVSGDAAKMISKNSVSDDLTVKFMGVSEGTSECIIKDTVNPSMSRSFAINVVSSADKKAVSQKAAELPEEEIIYADDPMENYAEKVLELINAERTSRGRSALTLNDGLCEAAVIRAKEVSVNFSHDRPDGTDFFTVIKNRGISYSKAGENIARNVYSPEDVVRGWMKSEKHRKNILEKKYTEMGIGYDPETGSWSQLFTAAPEERN